MTPKPDKRARSKAGDLPEFGRPPLAEVVLGVQFDPLVKLSAAQVGQVWDLYRSSFPRTEDQPPIAAQFERMGPLSEPGGFQLDVNLFTRPLLSRSWFINKAGDQLLQFQQDRFHHNWRRTKTGREYPRFGALRKQFAAEFELLERFIATQKLGEVVPNQCELTYINHIVAGEGWKEHREAWRVFRSLAEPEGGALLGRPEHIRYEAAQLIVGADSKPCGRLYVSVASGVLNEGGKPMFALTLTARGAPIGPGPVGVLGFLDLGHKWIVNGFADMTTEQMHKVWERRR